PIGLYRPKLGALDGTGADEGAERLLLALTTTHRLSIDPQRQRWIGVAHFSHDDGRRLAERVEEAGEGSAQRVEGEPGRDRRRLALGEVLVCPLTAAASTRLR